MNRKKKICLITGTTGGVGSITSSQLIQSGYTVIATDRKQPAIENADCRSLDVTKESEWKKLAVYIEKKYGRLDVLIQLAGVILPAYCYEIDEKQIDFHFNVNTKGTVLGIRFASALMMKNSPAGGRGHIINIASLAGIAPIGGIGLYSASKFAVRAFSLAAAQDLYSYKIRTTVICPDAIRTPMLDLQKDYEQAALTFSGTRPLSTKTVAERIVKTIEMKNPPLEILIPSGRGLLAKVASAFPAVQHYLSEKLRQKGLKKQKQYEL